MTIFTCAHCDNVVFFENVRCTNCGSTLAYFPEHGVVTAIEPLRAARRRRDAHPQLYRALAKSIKGKYRLCANSLEYGVCNAAVRADDPEPLCQVCRLNDVVPDLSDPDARKAWQTLERWKRRTLFTLRELRLPIESRAERPGHGLMFSFMRDSVDGNHKVFTGHNDGLITINIAEADDPFREKIRKQLGENYRTVLGHFRHEVGHYYWDQLIKDSPRLEQFRTLFGDETEPYQDAIDRHYKDGPPADWQSRFVSAYATMHPWEDWAETWAHYLHIIDTLETARAYSMVLNAEPELQSSSAKVAATRVDPQDFESLYRAWVPFTIALNSLNRSMGHPDAYPFVLSEPSVEKLRFVHGVVQSCKVTEVSPTDNTSQLTRSTVMKAVAIDPDSNNQATGA